MLLLLLQTASSVSLMGTKHARHSNKTFVTQPRFKIFSSLGRFKMFRKIVFSYSSFEIKHLVYIFMSTAIIVCLPLDSGVLSRTLVELDTMQDTRKPSPTAILIVYPFDPRPFVPFSPPANESVTTSSSDEETTTMMMNEEEETDRRPTGGFTPPRDLSRRTLENLLAIVPIDQR